MKKLAIIGTGIAGMACARRLHKKYDLTIFEKNDYVGGHTHTVYGREGSHSIPIDTGFMVYNERTYPRLVELFEELSVETMDTAMSFGVQIVDKGLEYACSHLGTFFAQRWRLLSLRHWRLLLAITRLFKVSQQAFEEEGFESLSLRDYFEQQPISKDAIHDFFIPMVSAIWSTPPEAMLDYPAITLLRFMKNHGLLGINTPFQWKTLKAGSDTYKNKLIADFSNAICINRGVRSLTRRNGCVDIVDVHGRVERFDAVIVAAHANEALRMLEQPTTLESRVLSCFCYNRNTVALHSDLSVMPKARAAWASWNYRVEPGGGSPIKSSVHYWMNRLQALAAKKDYFVSVDYRGHLDADKVHWKGVYEHPRFDHKAIHAQKALPELNKSGPIYYCGSYFGYGFHEDALAAALKLCQLLEAQDASLLLEESVICQ